MEPRKGGRQGQAQPAAGLEREDAQISGASSEPREGFKLFVIFLLLPHY